MSGPERITEHVYWLPPGPPDRPSLCVVVGDRRTIMLDGGSSRAHARALLDALPPGSRSPDAVVYTHSHWDHVFGGVEVGGLVIAHELTAAALLELAATDWSDEALNRRVAEGLASPQHAANVKEELPSPRSVEVAPADIVFQDGLEFDAGGVKLTVRHVGGDHAADSSVIFVEPDGVLFLGDCPYASPAGALTADVAFPLYDSLLGFGAEHFVEGHHEAVSSRSELEELFDKARLAERAAREGLSLESPDEDTAYFLDAFRAAL